MFLTESTKNIISRIEEACGCYSKALETTSKNFDPYQFSDIKDPELEQSKLQSNESENASSCELKDHLGNCLITFKI